MSEATFKAHLNDLINIFGLLQTDFETGPKGALGDWYDQMLDVIYDSEDTIENVINSRNNYDADSIDDLEIVEVDASSQEEMDLESEDDDELVDESDSEDLDIEDEDDEYFEDEDVESDEDTTANEYIIESNSSKTIKPTIVKIILK